MIIAIVRMSHKLTYRQTSPVIVRDNLSTFIVLTVLGVGVCIWIVTDIEWRIVFGGRRDISVLWVNLL